MIQLSSESIEELETLSKNNNISLLRLVKTVLENHLSQTTKYYTQGRRKNLTMIWEFDTIVVTVEKSLLRMSYEYKSTRQKH